MEIIAHIRTVFRTKFGVPRQSGLANSLSAQIIFEPKFRNPDCVKGLESFSHIWLLWEFSQVPEKEFTPTVRPPRLGGNKRMGVFATRSPFRPNRIGLSSVKLEKIELTEQYGAVLHITGADLADGTPIIDIKPYLAYTDSHPNAVGGFADEVFGDNLEVEFPAKLLEIVKPGLRNGLLDVLSQDPKPSYQNNPERVYGFAFSDYEIKFTVSGKLLTVESVEQK